MSAKIIGVFLAIAVVATPVGLSHATVDEHSQSAHAHQHHVANQAMRLNNGARWETDAPLRHAMATLKGNIHPLMQEIHQDQLAAERYETLARNVRTQATYMIENCELEGEADAQLHLVIAELLAGATVMQGDAKNQARRDGAIRVVGALNDYATYFEDPTFKKLEH